MQRTKIKSQTTVAPEDESTVPTQHGRIDEYLLSHESESVLSPLSRADREFFPYFQRGMDEFELCSRTLRFVDIYLEEEYRKYRARHKMSFNFLCGMLLFTVLSLVNIGWTYASTSFNVCSMQMRSMCWTFVVVASLAPEVPAAFGSSYSEVLVASFAVIQLAIVAIITHEKHASIFCDSEESDLAYSYHHAHIAILVNQIPSILFLACISEMRFVAFLSVISAFLLLGIGRLLVDSHQQIYEFTLYRTLDSFQIGVLYVAIAMLLYVGSGRLEKHRRSTFVVLTLHSRELGEEVSCRRHDQDDKDESEQIEQALQEGPYRVTPSNFGSVLRPPKQRRPNRIMFIEDQMRFPLTPAEERRQIVERIMDRILDPTYSVISYDRDVFSAFPELSLYKCGSRTSSGRDSFDELERTRGAFFAIFWLLRMHLDGRSGFCNGVDDNGQVIVYPTGEPQAADRMKRKPSDMTLDVDQRTTVPNFKLLLARSCKTRSMSNVEDTNIKNWGAMGKDRITSRWPPGKTAQASIPSTSSTTPVGKHRGAKAPSIDSFESCSTGRSYQPQFRAFQSAPESTLGVLSRGMRRLRGHSFPDNIKTTGELSFSRKKSFFKMLPWERRHNFYQNMPWGKMRELFVQAGILRPDGTIERQRMRALLVLTAVHDICKIETLWPEVEKKHAPFFGYQYGDVIRDHDVALSYLLTHYPHVLPSFHLGLASKDKQTILFTQSQMCFNHGWFVQAESPPGPLFQSFKALVQAQNVSASDLAFYFVHWLTDLAGGEPTPMRGSEKFVQKFPHQVLIQFIRSFPFVQDLAHKTETEVYEDYLRQSWRELQQDRPRVFHDMPDGVEAICLFRLLLQAQKNAVHVYAAFHALEEAQRLLLSLEMAQTGIVGQHYSVREKFIGPSILVYYGPAFLQKFADSRENAIHCLDILTEIYRQGRSLFLESALAIGKLKDGEKTSVMIHVDELKEVKGGLHCIGQVCSSLWVMEQTSSQDACVSRISMETLNSLIENKKNFRLLEFYAKSKFSMKFG